MLFICECVHGGGLRGRGARCDALRLGQRMGLSNREHAATVHVQLAPGSLPLAPLPARAACQSCMNAVAAWLKKTAKVRI